MNDVFEAAAFGLSAPVTDERPWAVFAACRNRDSDVFFPVTSADERAAIRVCSGCAVKAECLDFALEARVRFGVWGGATEKQRRSMQRRIA